MVLPPPTPGVWRTSVLTSVAMIAFAANSVLCRLALAPDAIDAASFTTLRLGSGALMLWLIVTWRKRPPSPSPVRGSWTSALLLFGYAITFSFAYRHLTAGTGALILFGLVQLTMLVAAILGGERPPVAEWLGLVAAVGGLIWLVLPGWSAPPPLGAAAMALAGIAWGLYSLRGRGASDALGATAGNFLRSAPPAIVVSAALATTLHASGPGIGWAVLSGAVTSGLGYVVWYAALRGLSGVRAAVVQLSVPVVAALGGAALLDEPITRRMVLSGGLILGGIALAVLARPRVRR